MLKIKIFYLIILFLFIILFSCARIKEFNTSPEPRELLLKRAKFTLKDGQKIEAKDMILDKESATLRFKDNVDLRSYKFTELTSLKYSNTNLSLPGFFLGAIIGGVICYNAFDWHEINDNSDNNYNDGIIVPNYFPTITEMILAPVIIIFNMYIGHKIGSQFYINWKEIELNRYYLINSYSLTTDFNRNRILLSIKIPIH